MSGTKQRDSIPQGMESELAYPREEPAAHSQRDLPADAPKAGDVIAGKYKIEGVLGAGGMGIVLSARHIELGQRVAIKIMRSVAALDPTAKERFLREARASVALSSEHVAKVVDVGTLADGKPYMVMEHLAGRDLGDVLRRDGRMAIADAVGAVLQACEALVEAHAIGIVHRDLKPSNLFVTKGMDGLPRIKVLDFGISKMVDAFSTSQRALTASGSVIGSPGYMSPEQVRSAKEVDLRSDIWALGVILYELLSGINPFRGDSMGETLARIVSKSPAPLRTLRPDVPKDLEATISMCLQRAPEKRVSSTGELASRLLPFAPPEGVLSVERILRASRGSGGQQTLSADDYPENSRGAGDHLETAQSWLRSELIPHPQSPNRQAILVGFGAASIVLVSLVGLYVARSYAPITARPADTVGSLSGSSVLMLAAPAPTSGRGTIPDLGEPSPSTAYAIDASIPEIPRAIPSSAPFAPHAAPFLPAKLPRSKPASRASGAPSSTKGAPPEVGAPREVESPRGSPPSSTKGAPPEVGAPREVESPRTSPPSSTKAPPPEVDVF